MRYRDLKLIEKAAERKRFASVSDEIMDKYQSKPDGLYATYTVIDKVGINPRSGYNTPIGIYCYPLWYVISKIEEQGSAEQVDYMGDAPYIHIIKANNPQQALEISSYGTNYASDVDKLKNYFVNQKRMTSEDRFDEIVESSYQSAKLRNKSSYIWNLTRLLSKMVASGELNESTITESTDLLYQDLTEWSDGKTPRAVVVWNGILRNILGYQFVDDEGAGLIHPAEPTQCVFLSKQALSVVDRFENKQSGLRYKMKIIDKIGGNDKPSWENDRRAAARRAFEYEKLISQNIDNPMNLKTLELYFGNIRSPRIQKSLISKNPTNIIHMTVSDPGIIQYARSEFVKVIKGATRGRNPTDPDVMLSDFQYSGLDRVFESMAVNGEWPEFEEAVVDYIRSKDSTYNSVFDAAMTYLFEFKDEKWPELEPFIKRRKENWRSYKSTFNIVSDKEDYYEDDLVIVNTDEGDEIAIITSVSDDEIKVSLLLNRKSITVPNDPAHIQILSEGKKVDMEDQLPFKIGDIVTFKEQNNTTFDLVGEVYSINFPYATVKQEEGVSMYRMHTVYALNLKLDETEAAYQIGDKVRITTGPYKGKVITISYVSKNKKDFEGSTIGAIFTADQLEPYVSDLKFKVGDLARASNPKATPRWTIVDIDEDQKTVRLALNDKKSTVSFTRFFGANPEYAPDDNELDNNDVDDINIDDVDFDQPNDNSNLPGYMIDILGNNFINKAKNSGSVTTTDVKSAIEAALAWMPVPDAELISVYYDQFIKAFNQMGINIIDDEEIDIDFEPLEDPEEYHKKSVANQTQTAQSTIDQSKLNWMYNKAKEDGKINYGTLNKVLDDATPEEIENIIAKLSSMGVEITEF